MTRSFCSGILAALAFHAICADLSAQRRIWQPDTRVVVSDGGTLAAVAVSPRTVYAAAEASLLAFDLLQSRWNVPLGLPLEASATRPSALAWDPVGGALWLGTESGDLYITIPGFSEWDRTVLAARGRIDAIVPAAADGSIFVLAGGEWFRVRGGSLMADAVPQNVVPPEVISAARPPSDPRFQAARGTLGLDSQRRRWQLTDAESGAIPGEYWIATAGGGLLHYDSRSDRREWYRYGLVGRGAGSVARLNGAIWFGGDGRGERSGVARAAADLADWVHYDAADGAPRGFVAEIVQFGGSTWFAASDGLFRLSGARGEGGRGEWTRFTSRDGLASDQVRSLIVAGDRLWVGTDRGLNAFDSSAQPAGGPWLQGRRISRLAARNDTLFVAANDGLRVLPMHTASENLIPFTDHPALRRQVQDLILADTLAVAIIDGVLYSLNGPASPIRDGVLDRIGPAFRLAMEEGRVWVAGPRGIAHRDPATGGWEAFLLPADIPHGPIVDVLPVGDDVWAATPAAAVRLRWR